MTDMPYEDFALPSALPGGGTKLPGMHQLRGRLIHMFPTAVEHGVTSELKKDPHTRLTCDVTFLDGDPIAAIVNGATQQVTQALNPPVMPGQTMVGMWISQAWFVSRLERKIGQPGFPGIVGIVGSQPSGQGAPMTILTDPTPAQLEQVKAWFAWKNANPGQGVYVPAAPVPQAVAPAPVYAQSVPAQPAFVPPVAQPAPVQQAPVPNPFAQPQPAAQPVPAAAPTGAPLPPWQQG